MPRSVWAQQPVVLDNNGAAGGMVSWSHYLAEKKLADAKRIAAEKEQAVTRAALRELMPEAAELVPEAFAHEVVQEAKTPVQEAKVPVLAYELVGPEPAPEVPNVTANEAKSNHSSPLPISAAQLRGPPISPPSAHSLSWGSLSSPNAFEHMLSSK